MSHGRLSQSAILEQLLEEDEEESESELSDQGSENTTTLLQRNLYLLKNQTSRTQKRRSTIAGLPRKLKRNIREYLNIEEGTADTEAASSGTCRETLYLGQMLIGFTISWSGPIIPKLQDLEQSPISHTLTDTQASLIASLLYIGCIPGPYLVGWLSNTKGRKPCFLLGGLLSIIGLGIVPNVLIGEMFTPNVRSNGSTLAITVTWLSGFLVTTAFGAIVNDVGAFVPFWFFSFTCILAFLFTIFFVPETKGKSLLEIQMDLGKK
ncbi:unnamed protein product [Danaus chrysippus]|uniref:(African queen) hypothetical protein n=1 Tax=Danaus chrysippus TaxID=151541 RepID=A0A8J2QWY4_9NEOP|nr:unnamed protein product [Danaus chrysippus]